MKLGSNDDGSFNFIDTIAIVSLVLTVENLKENLTQSDKQDLQNEISEQLHKALNEIHSHLERQDKQIKEVLEILRDDL